MGRPLKVAIGFGGCVDMFVDAVSFMEEMNMKPSDKVQHHDTIRNEEELAEGFLYYFTHGAAGERYVNNQTLFDQVFFMNNRRNRSFLKTSLISSEKYNYYNFKNVYN